MAKKTNYKNKNHRSDKDKYRNSSKRKDTRDDVTRRDREETGKTNDVMRNCGSENDPNWYNRDDALIKDVTKIPFTLRLGAPADPSHPSRFTFADFHRGAGNNYKSIPGICALDMHLSPGYSMSGDSAPNLAAANVFQYVRKKLNTVANYAPADILMYILGIDSIYAMYAHLVRLFGIYNVYSSMNLYYPKHLVKAAYGLSEDGWDEFIHNVANYKARFNNLIYKAASLYLPTKFTIIDRHAWLFSNYFVDRDSVKGQIYIHRPTTLYALNETVSDNGTCLEPFSVVGTDAQPNTITALLDTFSSLIDNYLTSDSMMKIAADMRRAFDDAPSWSLSYVTDDLIIGPTASDEVLLQISNTTVVPKVQHTETPVIGSDWIFQDVTLNTVVFAPEISWTGAQAAWFRGSQFINIPKVDPSNDDILVATRGIVASDPAVTGNKMPLSTVASDWCEGLSIYRLNPSGVSDHVDISCCVTTGPLSSAPGTDAIDMYEEFLTEHQLLSAFDWAPPHIFVKGASAYSPTTIEAHPFWEVDNVTPIDFKTLLQLNTNIMLNMWNIPLLGTM